MPFKSPQQELYLMINKPELYEKWKKKYGHHPDFKKYLKQKNESKKNDKYVTTFKTWFDKIKKKSESDKMLTKIPKNKYDTTMIKTPDAPKKTPIKVWGAPSNYNYIRI